MTQRSIHAGQNQTIIIKVGENVNVKGSDSDRVTAESQDPGGLALERRSGNEIGRARAAIGDRALFDIRIKVPNLKEKKTADEVIEVQMGGSGEVLVPFESNVKIYAGKDIDVQGINGQVDAYAGFKLNLQDVYQLGNASAGSTMNIECQTLLGDRVEFKSGGDLRFHVHDLTNSHIRIRDLGGYWEARIGDGKKSIYLKCGGDAVLVTDQKVESLPPNHVLGKIEKPPKS